MSEHTCVGDRRPVDVDMLTDEEIDELARMVERGDPDWVLATSDARLAGMYDEFRRLGLIQTVGGTRASCLSPTAAWAVEKKRQRKAEASADRERQWKHDRKMAWIAAASGFLGAVIGAALTVALEYWLLP